MMTNAEIMRVNLSHSIKLIQDKLHASGSSFYEKEFENLTAALQAPPPRQKLFFEKKEQHHLVKMIMDIIDKIDKDIASIETEMHGTLNYSEYESKRVDEAALKREIQGDLDAMLDVVLSTRPVKFSPKL
jgi:hypothetical protein